MKKTLLAVAGSLLAATALAAPSNAADIKLGIIGGISGPIAAMAPAIIDASQLAVKQVNDQGGILDGDKLVGVVGDAACSPQNATDAVTKAVNVDGVVAVVGPDCSGSVLAAAGSVTIPAGIAMITPSGTSPEITALKDNDTVFRTVPSDDFQGRALARTLRGMGYEKIAVAYLNNDYGTGLAKAFKDEFEAQGGTVAGFAAHEGEKASYRSDLAELASNGANTLAIFDYGDGSGLTMLRQALENGFFEKFVGADGMKSEALIKEIGSDNLSTFVTSSPVGEKSKALDAFSAAFKAANGDPNAIFVTTSYDAAFLAALAIEKAGGDKAKIPAAIRAVAGGEGGEPIYPGEWKKAKQLIDAGKAIDYKGASGDLNFDAAGDVPGNYALFKASGKTFEVVSEMK